MAKLKWLPVLQPLRLLFEDLADAIAPARCMGCLQEDTWLCLKCHQSLHPLASQCLGCKVATERYQTCSDCLPELGMRGVLSVGTYHSPLLQRGIHWLKFKSVKPVAAPLAVLVLEQLHTIAPLRYLQDHAVLVPIPLHTRRQRWRGFNQSEAIADELSLLSSIPVLSLLKRTRATKQQTKLVPELRRENIKSAFALDTTPSPDRPFIILLDDVATTGSTLSSAAKTILFDYPDLTIWGATIARG